MGNLQKVYVLANELRVHRSRSQVEGFLHAHTRRVRVRYTCEYSVRELSFPLHSALRDAHFRIVPY